MCAMSPRLLRPLQTGFSPGKIAGLVGWYDSADLTAMAQNSDGTGAVAVGDQVGYWKDKSATAAQVTQATGANRPTLTAAAVNGRAALDFDGSNDTLSCGSYTAQGGLSGLTRISVYSTSQGSLHSRTLNVGTFGVAGPGSSFNTSVASPAAEVTPAIRGASVLVGMSIIRSYGSVFDGAAGTLQVFANNVLQTQTYTNGGVIPATTNAAVATIHIGSNLGFNLFVNGPIAEYLIYSRALSASEMAAIHSYLQKKWGVA